MEFYLNFFIYNFILDMLIMYIMKKHFKLSSSFVMITFIQILNVMTSAVYLFCNLSFMYFVLIKLSVNFIVCLLIIDNFSLKSIICFYGSYILLFFSIFGFAEFMLMFIRASFVQLFEIKIPVYYNFIVIICTIMYVFFIGGIVRLLSHRRVLKNYLTKVSFSLFCQHIEIVGLLDSGNSLTDTKTGKPVVIMSIKSLKKYLPKHDYLKVVAGDYSPLHVSNFLDYVTVGGKGTNMPIVEIENIVVEKGDKVKKLDCVIGFVDQKFGGDDGYECLLHRDFI